MKQVTKPKGKGGVPTKRTKAIRDKILALIRKDTYKVSEVCKQVGICEAFYYKWKAEDSEFMEAIEKAHEERRAEFAVDAENSLHKLVSGFFSIETKTVTGVNGTIKEHTTVTKEVAPNVAAVIFTLSNLDPERWQNKQYNEHTGKGGKDLMPESIQVEIIDSRNSVDGKEGGDENPGD